jgi:hypothetical protein
MSEYQNYKGDETELKYKAVGNEVFMATNQDLNDFKEGAYNCGEFLLMLYDEDRTPYSDRIPRDSFVSFYRKALENIPFIGNFESYLFILREIFGQDVDVFFEVPAAGKLNISVNPFTDTLFDAIVRELVSGVYEYYDLITSDGDELAYKTLPGVETEAELNLLFSEIIPAGIFPTVSLDFFVKSTFYGVDDDGESDIITSFDDTIIFIEVGA